jgi:hypothetical protein
MQQIMENLEFFAAFSVAIEVGFETLFSLPGIEGYFEKRKKERAYIKRLAILAFCLIMCSALYTVLDPSVGALFLERTFGKKVPIVDVVLTALILTGGSRAVHEALLGLRNAATPKSMRGTSDAA